MAVSTQTKALLASLGILALMGGIWLTLSIEFNFRPSQPQADVYPIVVNTWNFTGANEAAWDILKGGGSALDAVEAGCNFCEFHPYLCDYTVGYGGSPNEVAETTLDAMIMDGVSMQVGAVGCLKNITAAISIARLVMEQTYHTFLVGQDATNFALQFGYKKENLTTLRSLEQWQQWVNNGHQPNYWKYPHNYSSTLQPSPNPSAQPPVFPADSLNAKQHKEGLDTIGMVAIDSKGRVVAGTSTNGKIYKIPGRVGDSPIAGAGAYADAKVGAAAGTGDGDILMRFLPSYRAVMNMKNGMSPTAACQEALSDILRLYPNTTGGLVAINTKGEWGAATINFNPFEYAVRTPQMNQTTVYSL